MRIITLNCSVSGAALEWCSPVNMELSDFARSVMERFCEINNMSEAAFVSLYLSPEDERHAQQRNAPSRRKQERLYATEEEFSKSWRDTFAGRAESLRRYDWFMNYIMFQFCQMKGWDNLPDEFYGAGYLDDSIKLEQILNLRADVVALQGVSDELYDMLAGGINRESFAISGRGSSVLIWRMDMFPGMARDDVGDDQIVCYQNGEYVLIGACVATDAQRDHLRGILEALGHLNVVVMGDFGSRFECAGYTFATDLRGTQNRARTYLQPQYKKAMIRMHAITEAIGFARGSLKEFKTLLLNQEEVEPHARPFIPRPGHGADHYMLYVQLEPDDA